MSKKYLATIQIVVEADSEAEACDAISASLTENLMQSNAIWDWQYVPPVYTSPQPVTDEQLSIFGERGHN